MKEVCLRELDPYPSFPIRAGDSLRLPNGQTFTVLSIDRDASPGKNYIKAISPHGTIHWLNADYWHVLLPDGLHAIMQYSLPREPTAQNQTLPQPLLGLPPV